MSCALLANSKADISSVSKVFVKDAGAAEYSSGKQSDLSVIKLAASEYEQLVINGMTSPNALYVVSSDYINAYGEQLKNLAAATDLSDAVTLEQLNSLSSKFYQLPANGIPGSDMALSVQTAIEKAEVSISSIPDPIDPLSATLSGQYADALATKNALSRKADLAAAADPLIPMTGHAAVLNSNGNLVDSGIMFDDVIRYHLSSITISSGTIAPSITL